MFGISSNNSKPSLDICSELNGILHNILPSSYSKLDRYLLVSPQFCKTIAGELNMGCIALNAVLKMNLSSIGYEDNGNNLNEKLKDLQNLLKQCMTGSISNCVEELKKWVKSLFINPLSDPYPTHKICLETLVQRVLQKVVQDEFKFLVQHLQNSIQDASVIYAGFPTVILNMKVFNLSKAKGLWDTCLARMSLNERFEFVDFRRSKFWCSLLFINEHNFCGITEHSVCKAKEVEEKYKSKNAEQDKVEQKVAEVERRKKAKREYNQKMAKMKKKFKSPAEVGAAGDLKIQQYKSELRQEGKRLLRWSTIDSTFKTKVADKEEIRMRFLDGFYLPMGFTVQIVYEKEITSRWSILSHLPLEFSSVCVDFLADYLNWNYQIVQLYQCDIKPFLNSEFVSVVVSLLVDTLSPVKKIKNDQLPNLEDEPAAKVHNLTRRPDRPSTTPLMELGILLFFIFELEKDVEVNKVETVQETLLKICRLERYKMPLFTFEPCHSVVFSNVVCRDCYQVRDFDLCCDDQLISQKWLCEECSTPYYTSQKDVLLDNKPDAEVKIMKYIREREKEFHGQQLVCSVCNSLKISSIAEHCSCGHPWKCTIKAKNYESELKICKVISDRQGFSVEDLFEFLKIET